MPDLFIFYLCVQDIITLGHVSKTYRQFILQKFEQIYHISTGFCSVEQWFLIIYKNCFSLIDDILNQNFFDEVFFNYHFDLEENNFALRKEYRRHFHYVCIFLRCVRSCDKKPVYCKNCSRARDYQF